MAPPDVAPSIALLALSTIRECPTNPRRTFDQVALDELAESIREKGVLQPVLVRPASPSGYELVFGHRRVRAARAAGLAHVPAMVAALTDQQMLEAQVVENAQRADVHPLEEADGYRRLHETYGYSAEELAAKVGKSVSYVYARLKLCSLGDAGRAAFAAGKLDASRALLIARIPDPGLQEQACERLTTTRSWAGGEPMGFREAVKVIQTEFMLRLSGATFATKACAKCPKRTGAQPELFADVDSADLCTDPGCFAAKTDEAWQVRKAKAEAAGQRVLSDEETKTLLPYGNVTWGSGWAELDDRCRHDPAARTWREVLGEVLGKNISKRVALARTDAGKIHELVVEEDALDELRSAGVISIPDEDEEKAAALEDEKSREDSSVKREANILAVGECAARAETSQRGEEIWRLLGHLLTTSDYGQEYDEVLERRGLTLEDDQLANDRLRKVAAEAPLSVVRGLVLELALDAAVGAVYDEDREQLRREVYEFFGVDFPKLEAGVRSAREEAVKRAAAAAKKKVTYRGKHPAKGGAA